MSAYGYARETTPAIDSIARDGFLFERAYAQSNWTKPSVASLLTGLYVRRHGVVVGTDYFDDAGRHIVAGNSFPLPEDLPMISEAFADAAYRTAGFVENSHIVPEQGFGRGFEIYEKVGPASRALRKWLDELDDDERFFAYLHLIGPHDPYDGSLGKRFAERYRTRFGEFDSSIDWTDLGYRKTVDAFSREDLLQANALYDAEILYHDQEQIAPVLAWLREQGRYEETLIVVTADHGEELWDHGNWAHGKTLYEEVIRVPLIVKPARSNEGPRRGGRFTELVEQIDLFPTLCELAGCSAPESIDGRSFAGLILGERTQDPDAYAISEYAKGVRSQIQAVALMSGDKKWIEFHPAKVGPTLAGPRASRGDPHPPPVLLEAGSDRLVEPADPAAIGPLNALLERVLGPGPEIEHAPVAAVGHSPAELEQLRALGYVE